MGLFQPNRWNTFRLRMLSPRQKSTWPLSYGARLGFEFRDPVFGISKSSFATTELR